MKECVSVIIPSFNRAHILGLTLPSYVQENVGEIIIIDDCSSDNTEEVVNELILQYPLIKYFKNDKNMGQCYSLNRGLDMASLNYIYIGDDDSFITDRSIQILLSTLLEYNVQIVGALQVLMKSKFDYLNKDQFIRNIVSNRITEINKYIDLSRMKLNFSFYIDFPIEVPVCHASLLVSKEMLDKNNIRYDPNYKRTGYRQETDFIIRVNLAGYKIMYEPKAMQINLPREIVKGGGAHNGSKIWRYKSLIDCNNYFLDKNYDAIRAKYPKMQSKLSLKYLFIFGIIKQMVKDPIITLFNNIGVLHLFIKSNKYD